MKFTGAAPLPINLSQARIFQFIEHLRPPLLLIINPGRGLAVGFYRVFDRRNDPGAVQSDIRQVVVA